MIYLLEEKCTTIDHSLKAAVSSSLRASNLKFTEHDNKRPDSGRKNHHQVRLRSKDGEAQIL